jgi:hypothetical protein
MGFTGLSGTSDRALSALMHYGLAERVGKGEIRVTDLALSAIHPESLMERRAALREAGFNPTLFRELRDRYPGPPPSLGSLSSYLSRENFAPAAIAPAAKAYLETCQFLQREQAYESGSEEAERGAEPSNMPVPIDQPAQVHNLIAAPSQYGFQSVPPNLRAPVQRPDVFTIGSDGEVVVSLPTVLTQEAYDDLKDWLDLIARKAKRKIVATPTPPTNAKSEDDVSDLI